MGYDSIAEGYDRFVRERSRVHRVSIPALLQLCGPGGRVLDLACGQGVLARALAASGRTVVGVDVSSELLRIAEEVERAKPLGIEYIRDNARSLTALHDASFDGVASNLFITDIDDLRSALLSVARVLKPGGWFALATLHPCFNPPYAVEVRVGDRAGKQVGRYFEEGRWWSDDTDRLLARLGWHHRTLSTLLNLLLEAGFRLDRFVEPQPSASDTDVPGRFREVAEVLAVRSLLL